MVLTYIGTTFELANYEYWKISLDLLLVAWDANCLAMTDWVLAWALSLDLLLVAWDANCLATTDWVLAGMGVVA